MDVAGARALAERIAQGKPIGEETTPAPPIEPADGPRRDVSQADAAADEVEVVFVHPRLLDRRPKVWMYVRGPDGHLHRAR
jgi:hypothetical protein